MKDKRLQIPTRFTPETAFELSWSAGPSPAAKAVEVERLKNRLLEPILAEAGLAAAAEPVRRAANEAAALAFSTPYPLLVLPVLLEEKAQAARRQVAQQAWVIERSRTLALEGA